MSDERERMLQTITDGIKATEDAEQLTNRLIAAGFGDVAAARREAIDECTKAVEALRYPVPYTLTPLETALFGVAEDAIRALSEPTQEARDG